MRIHRALSAGLVAAGALTLALPAQADTSDALKIDYDIQTLANGMTVILHEDHTQPLVTVNINVNVGSRDEKQKRTGFAHLFEHLMFMGTKRVPEKMFDAWMEAEGGWNNAWTSEDRTDYYDVGPSHVLPLLLWMEADRLSELGGQITQSKLDKQRDVVRNERRQQVENQPYGIAELRLPELLYPADHPYHHPVIGSHEDLEAASVADVKDFFATYYVPQNMSLVIAGDFDAAKTMPLVKQYFGSIPKAQVAPKRGTESSVPALGSVVRETLEDNVTLPKVVMAWLSPPLYTAGDAELDIISDVLTEGKSSKLYNALVYEEQIAQSVTATQASGAIRSYFSIEVVANEGVSLDKIEAAVDAKLTELTTNKISERELNRVKNQYEAGFVRRMQSLSTRASMLNGYFANHGNPGYAAKDLQRYLDVTTDDVLSVAKQVLDPNKRVILRIVPRPEAQP
jgi:predicted Zn-dependent peptidase